MKTPIKISMILFLYVGVFMMVGHSIIPHHHHTDSFFSHKENHCPSSEQEQKDSHDSPFHCHAFNNTDWYKQNNSSVKLSKITVQLLSICTSRISYPLKSIIKIKWICNYSVIKEAPLLELSFPRPPPLKFN